MTNNSDYFRAHLESEARYKEHAQHISEFAIMCKMMIEETVPILIEKYIAEHKQSVIFDVKTYLNGKIVDFKTELSNACARVFQKFMV